MNFQHLRSQKGQTLAVAVMLMLVALIMVPLLVSYVQTEAKWTVKQGKSTSAYHLAEAGQDRAIWHLVLSSANWSNALSATAQAGYNGDVQYTDLPGGAYTVKYSSGPAADEVTVTTKGRDAMSGEIRTIQAIYSGTLLLSGFVAQGSVDYPTTFTVYWGQVTSYTSITLGGSVYHPQKVSKGAISPFDSSPTPPNADSTKGYSAYDAGLTSPPIIDFAYYREKAKASIITDPALVGGGSHGSQTVTYRGTGYFDGGTKAGGAEVKFKNYTLNCTTCVIFIELDKAKLDGSGYMHVEGLLVYSSNIHIHNTGANPYVVSVPTDAWKQYTAGTVTTPTTPDAAATNQYPGDGGYNTAQPTYSIPTVAFDGATNTGMSFHGFLYANSFDCNGGVNSNVGQFQIGPGGTSISTMIIYFDPAVAGNVKYTKSSLRRVSWNETLSSWP
ncbi:MAG: hypothetical protein HY923_01950 [Elusimicrobia bacterium]|nr:hypothetical protein [Elusimicrobiota bacterium]